MGCDPIIIEGKVVGIACSRGKRNKTCVECKQNDAPLLCDWKLTGDKAGQTCDRRLCTECAVQPAPDKDLCPAHGRAWEKWKAERA